MIRIYVAIFFLRFTLQNNRLNICHIVLLATQSICNCRGLQTTARVPNPVRGAISSDPRSHFVNNKKNNIITKNLLIWKNVTYPETVILRKMSGPRTVA